MTKKSLKSEQLQEHSKLKAYSTNKTLATFKTAAPKNQSVSWKMSYWKHNS